MRRYSPGCQQCRCPPCSNTALGRHTETALVRGPMRNEMLVLLAILAACVQCASSWTALAMKVHLFPSVPSCVARALSVSDYPSLYLCDLAVHIQCTVSSSSFPAYCITSISRAGPASLPEHPGMRMPPIARLMAAHLTSPGAVCQHESCEEGGCYCPESA